MASLNQIETEPNWPYYDEDLMTNCIHEIDHKVAKFLKDNKVKSNYPGWNFNAWCWYNNNKYHASVKVYGKNKGIFSADTPERLMQIVSDEFGWN